MTRSAFILALATLSACGSSSSSDNKMIGPCPSDVNGCTTFEDHTGGPFTITFTDFAYTPRCTKVSVGQPITFSGDFTFHPLSETCGPVDAIPRKTSGSTETVTFTTAGTYGFQCDRHHATNDMVGAIQVVP